MTAANGNASGNGSGAAGSGGGVGGSISRALANRGSSSGSSWSNGSSSSGSLVPVSASSSSDVWLSATASQSGSARNAVFTETRTTASTDASGSNQSMRPIDTVNVSMAPVFNDAIGMSQSAIGLGSLLDVGGAWGSGSGYSGFSQVFPQSFGLGFEGYHQGFSQANPTPNAPDGPHFEPPPPQGPPGSFFNNDNPNGGPPPFNGNGPNQDPQDSHHDNPRFDDHGPGGQTPPVTATPEPGSIVLLATGLLVMIPIVRRRRRA